MTTQYFADYMRLAILSFGGFWLFMGYLIWKLKETIEEGDTFIFWRVLNNPYITSAQGRYEHAIFVSKIFLLFGIPTFTIALFLPNAILEEWSFAIILFLSFGTIFMKVVFIADAKDREARHGRKGIDEGEAERIRKLEEEGKLR